MEMLQIPGIDPDKVERYGQRFLKLIRSSQKGYYELKQQQEAPPEDPNHQNVITISSEDEFADDCDLDEFLGEDGSQEERSSYFRAAPDVDAFNARCKSFSPCSEVYVHLQLTCWLSLPD